MNTKNKILVEIIESERGWGQRIDSVKEFYDLKEAEKYVKKYNSRNTLEEVPDWYMYARIQ